MGVGPTLGHPTLLGSNLGFQFLVNGNRGLSMHLVVEIAQVGGALSVVEQTVEGERARVGGA